MKSIATAMAPLLCALLVFLAGSPSLRADEAEALRGKIVDVTTQVVVQMEIEAGQAVPGRLASATRDGKEVARLKVRTPDGVLQVLEGDVRLGDLVKGLPQDPNPFGEPSQGDDDDDDDAAPTTLVKQDVDERLRPLLEAQGQLAVGDYHYERLTPTLRTPLQAAAEKAATQRDRLNAAARVLRLESREERVAAALRDLGETELARRMSPKAEPQTPLAPIMPADSQLRLASDTYGEIRFIDPQPALWKLPQYWGRNPLLPAFAGWQLEQDLARIAPGAEPLMRADFMLDDVRITGQVQPGPSGLTYLLLRSQVVVAFAQPQRGDAYGSVATKNGFSNLNHLLSSYAADEWEYAPPIKPGKWVPFTITLRGRQLTVEVEGDKLIDTTLRGGAEYAQTGYVGMGAYRGGGALRNVQVAALTDAGSRSIPLFATSTSYEPAGEAIDLLTVPKERFMSLSHHNEEGWKEEQHVVEQGTLQILGAPFSQFAVEDTEGDHWRAAGRVNMKSTGSVWFRANKYLFFGLRAKEPGDAEDQNPSLLTKFNTGNFRVYSEKFDGPDITARRWYSWEMEYHHPYATFKLDGETIMVAVARTEGHEPRQIGPNQFGISAYGTEADVANLKLQMLRPADRSLNPDQVRRAFIVGDRMVDDAVKYLGTLEQPNAPIAAAILTGERPPSLANSADFLATAQAFRDEFDWPTYLAILQAEYQRYPEGDPLREEGEKRWNIEQQKYEIALEVTEPGQLGIDNIIRLGGQLGPVQPDTDRRHVWYALEGGGLYQFDPQRRRVARSLKADFTIRHLVPRASHLIAVAEDARSIYRLDPETAKSQAEVTVPKGRILDVAAHPRLPVTYIAIDENTEPRKLSLANYRIYTLDEKEMTLTFSGGYGQFVTADPLGRYIYSGLTWQIQPEMEFDPGGLNVQQSGAYIDHLIAYTPNLDQLVAIGEKPSPGIAGSGIIADPQGRTVIYVGRGGMFDPFDSRMRGAKLGVLRSTAVARVLGTIDVGQGLEVAAYHPTLLTLYSIVKGELRVYNGRTRSLMRSETLPEAVRGSAIGSLTPTPDGRYLMVGYVSGANAGGIYLHPLPAETETAVAVDSEMLADPEAALKAALDLNGPAKVTRLKSIAENFAFTETGEEASQALLKAEDSPYAADSFPEPTLEPLALEDLAEMPTMASLELPADQPAEGAADRVDPKHGENDEFRESVVDLISFEATAENQPWSWLHECQALERKFPDSVELKLMAAEKLRDLEHPAAVATLASRVLELTDAKGWHAAQAYTLLAWAAQTQKQPGLQLAYLDAARQILPQNAVIQRRLGDLAAANDMPNRARYHRLVSIRLFPGQPDLAADLRQAGAISSEPDPDLSIPQLFQTKGPSVVLIRQDGGAGTGFFISRDGMLLTNQHVIREATEVTVFLDEGETEHALPARVVAVNRHHDMALLQVDLGEIQVEPLVLAPAEDLTTGERVIVIGNPGMGPEILTKSVTEGIVSKTKRMIGGHSYIQTSAAVNPGNSGGPMFNIKGQVVGMVTLKASLDNVGFAIPTDDLAEFLNDNL